MDFIKICWKMWVEFVGNLLIGLTFPLGNLKNGCVSPLAAPPPPPVRAFDPQGAARSRRWRCGKVMSLPESVVRQLSRTQDLLTFWWPPSCSPHKGVALRRCVVATTRLSSMPALRHFLRPSLETPRRYGVPSSRRCVGASVQRHACTAERRCASAPRHRRTSLSHTQIHTLI